MTVGEVDKLSGLLNDGATFGRPCDGDSAPSPGPLVAHLLSRAEIAPLGAPAQELDHKPEPPGGLASDDQVGSVVANEDATGRGELDELPQGSRERGRVSGPGELARDDLHVTDVALADEGGEVGHARRRFGLSLNSPLPVWTTSPSAFFDSA